MDKRQKASSLLVKHSGCCDVLPSPLFRTAALIPQLPGVCLVTVLILVPLENCLQLKAAVLSKVMSPSQEVARIHWLGHEGRALLPQSGKNIQGYANSRASYKIAEPSVITHQSSIPQSALSCFLHSLTEVLPEATVPLKFLECKYPSQSLFSGNSTITL